MRFPGQGCREGLERERSRLGLDFFFLFPPPAEISLGLFVKGPGNKRN
uniref:Uncharacterized protein n=1 Tax=Anguilla anguilla TaxID=7936 RepID=A0A0E9XGD8_ANGAN